MAGFNLALASYFICVCVCVHINQLFLHTICNNSYRINSIKHSFWSEGLHPVCKNLQEFSNNYLYCCCFSCVHLSKILRIHLIIYFYIIWQYLGGRRVWRNLFLLLTQLQIFKLNRLQLTGFLFLSLNLVFLLSLICSAVNCLFNSSRNVPTGLFSAVQ